MTLNSFSPDFTTWLDVFFRIAAATLLPLALGIERFLRRKPIDFRPFVIISVGACGLLLGAMELLDSTADPQSKIDPTRVVQGVITGIGFLGAGAMFREGDFVRGAASAASIWSAGAIGLVCGMGELWLAAVVAGITLLIMVIGEPLTEKWHADS
jgi:putative Mg2+ transporter-C (MgtC) family protein